MAFGGLKVKKKSEKKKGNQVRGDADPAASATPASSIDLPIRKNTKFISGFGKNRSDVATTTSDKASVSSALLPNIASDTTNEVKSPQASSSAPDSRRRLRMPSGMSLKNKRSFNRSVTVGDRPCTQNPQSSKELAPATPRSVSAYGQGLPVEQTRGLPRTPVSGTVISSPHPNDKDKDTKGIPASLLTDKSKIFAPGPLVRKKSAASLRSEVASEKPGDIITFGSPLRSTSFPASPVYAPATPSYSTSTRNGLAPSISGAGLNLPLASYQSPNEAVSKVQETNTTSSIQKTSNALSYLTTASVIPTTDPADTTTSTVVQHSQKEPASSQTPQPSGANGDDMASLYDSDEVSVDSTYTSHNETIMYDALDSIDTGSVAHGGRADDSHTELASQLDEKNALNSASITDTLKSSKDPFQPSDDTSFKMKKLAISNEKNHDVSSEALQLLKAAPGINKGKSVESPLETEISPGTNSFMPPPDTKPDLPDPQPSSTSALSPRDKEASNVLSHAETLPPAPAESMKEPYEQSHAVEQVKENLAKNHIEVLEPVAASDKPSKSFDTTSTEALKTLGTENSEHAAYPLSKSSSPSISEPREPKVYEKDASRAASVLPINSISLAPVASSQTKPTNPISKHTNLLANPIDIMPVEQKSIERAESVAAPTKQDISPMDHVAPPESDLVDTQPSKVPTKPEVASIDSAPSSQLEATTNAPEPEGTKNIMAHPVRVNLENNESSAKQSASPAISGVWSNLLPFDKLEAQCNEIDEETTQAKGPNTSESLVTAVSPIAGAATGPVLSGVSTTADETSQEQHVKLENVEDEALKSSSNSEPGARTEINPAIVHSGNVDVKNETLLSTESSTDSSFVQDIPKTADLPGIPEKDAAVLEDEAASEYTIKDEADASVHMGNKSKDQELVSEKASVLEPLVEKDSRPVNTAIAAAPIVGSSSGNDLLSVSTVEDTPTPTMQESVNEEISTGPVPVEPLRIPKRGNVDTMLPVASLSQEPVLPAQLSADGNETPQPSRVESKQTLMPTDEQPSKRHSVAMTTQQTTDSDKLPKASDDSQRLDPTTLDESEAPKRRSSLFKAAGEFLGSSLPFSLTSRFGDVSKNSSKESTEESTPESKLEPERKSKPELESMLGPEVKSEPELEPKPEPKPEPQSEPEPKPDSESELKSMPGLQTMREPPSQPGDVSAMDRENQLLNCQPNFQQVTADHAKQALAAIPKPEESIPVTKPLEKAAPTEEGEVKQETQAELAPAAPEAHHEPIMPQSAASPELPHRPIFAPLAPGTTLPWAMGTMPLPQRAQGMMQGTSPAVPSASLTGVDDELPTPPEPFQPPEPLTHHEQPDPTQLVQPPQGALQPAVSLHAVPGEIVPNRFASSLADQPWPRQEQMEAKSDLSMPTEPTQPFASGPPLPTKKEEAVGQNEATPSWPVLGPPVPQPTLWQPNEDEHDLAEEQLSRRYTLEKQPELENYGPSFEPRFLHTVPEEQADTSAADASQINDLAEVKGANEPVAAPALPMQAPNIFSVDPNAPLQGTGQYDPHQVRGFIRAMDTDNYEHAMRRASRMGVPLDVIPSNNPVPYPDPPENLPRPSELFAGKGVRWDSPDWLRSQLRKNVEAPSQAKFHAFLKSRRQVIPAFVWHDVASDPALHGEEYVDLAAPSTVPNNEPESEQLSTSARHEGPQPLETISKTENEPLHAQDTASGLQDAADIVPTLPLLLPDSYLLSDSDPIETSLLNLDELERSYQSKIHPSKPIESNERYTKYPYNSELLMHDQAVVAEAPPSLPPKIPSSSEYTPNRPAADGRPWNEHYGQAPFTQPQFMPPAPHTEMPSNAVYQQQFVPLPDQAPVYDGGLHGPVEYAHEPRHHPDEPQNGQDLTGQEYGHVSYPEPTQPHHYHDVGFPRAEEFEHNAHPHHQPVEPQIHYSDPAFGTYAGDTFGPYPGQLVPYHDPAMHGLQPGFAQPYPGPDSQVYQMPMQPRPDLHTQPFVQQALVPQAHITPYQQFSSLTVPQHEQQTYGRDQGAVYDENFMHSQQAWLRQQVPEQQPHPEFYQHEPHRFGFAHEEQAHENHQPQVDYAQQQQSLLRTWDDGVVSASAPSSPIALRDPHLTSDMTNTDANSASISPGWQSPGYQSMKTSGFTPMLSSTPTQKYDTKKSKRRGGSSHRTGWAALLHNDPLSALQ